MKKQRMFVARVSHTDAGAKSTWRGHPTTWNGRHWLFDDNHKEVTRAYGKRPCANCQRVFQGSNIGDPDPCLGNLPGVKNACCGHGVPSMAYVVFNSGVVLEGFTVRVKK